MKKRHLNWPSIQKDKDGSLILYPATLLFSRKGYIIPDEKIRKEFININIPIFVLGALALIHTIGYGFFVFIVVYAFWQLMLYIVHYNFF
ncbi:MAG: hypothetical protein KAJ62_09485 [Desulfobacteraceae bacterium]|nr:hypothetical protein [Desulfobacteraceae bacterium]